MSSNIYSNLFIVTANTASYRTPSSLNDPVSPLSENISSLHKASSALQKTSSFRNTIEDDTSSTTESTISQPVSKSKVSFYF